MAIFLFIGLVIGGAAVVFVLQNTAQVSVSFLAWHLSGSLSLVILAALLCGMLVAMLVILPGFIKAEWQVRRLAKANKKLMGDTQMHETPQTSKVTEPMAAASENVVDLDHN